MKSMQLLSMGILSILVLSPTMASAQDSTGSASTDVKVETGTVATTDVTAASSVDGKTMSEDSWTTTSARASTTAPIKKILAPRDPASGQATGKRTSASGTQPLGAKLEGQLEKRDEAMERRASTTSVRKEEARERMEEKRGEILKRISQQMISRMNAAIERYETLASRLDSRITKLKEKGVDTSKAEANIVIARSKISEAKIAVAVAVSGIETAVVTANTASSTKPVDAGKTVRESLLKARTAVEAAHKALTETIVSLRANVKVEGSATTTVAQ